MATRAPKRSARSRDGFDEAALDALGFDERPNNRGRSTSSGRQGTSGTRAASKPRTSSGSAKTGSAKSGSARSGTGSSRAGRPSASKPAAKKPAAKRRPPARKGPPPAQSRKASHDPFVLLGGWVGRAIVGAWLIVAGGAGFVARWIGRGARDLDPHHRRDGLGLLTLGGAIVLAASIWWRMGNPVGRALLALFAGALGSLASVLPLLVALLAWRFLRHPDRNSETARAAIGWTAFLIGALGII